MKHLKGLIKNKIWTGIVLLFITGGSASAQSAMSDILLQVSENNLELKSAKAEHEANSLSYKTGNGLPGFAAEYEYISANTPQKVYQHDFLAKQEFAFPSVYQKRKQLSNEQMKQSEEWVSGRRQVILNESRLSYIRIVYYLKLQKELLKVKNNTEKVLAATGEQLNKGSGNILEMNKARLQMLDAENKYFSNESLLEQELIHLTALNGGKPVNPSGFEYEAAVLLPEFELLESEIESYDPELKMIRSEQSIAEKRIRIARSENLPSFSLGYRYQGLAETNFNGIHAGIKIPLWEHKNKLKFQKADLIRVELAMDEHLNEHRFRIMKLYEKYKTTKARLETYQSALAGIKTPELLSKAFDAGHISLSEYYMDMNLYLHSQENLLQYERELQEIVAMLTMHKL